MSKKRGRPIVLGETEIVSIRIPVDLMRSIKMVARETGSSTHGIIRGMISRGVDGWRHGREKNESLEGW